MENLKKRLNKKRGFTLVELLVVIAIIAILSVTAYVALGGQTGKARDSRRQADLSAIQNALEIHALNNNSQYPDPTLAANIDSDVMPEVPVDPWGGDYDYAVAGNNRTYLLAATLEGDDGDLSSFVVGNGAEVLLAGMGILEASCGGANTPCDLTDAASDTCVPYCSP